ETLVMEVLDGVKGMPTPKVLDLCTGSGCVAVAVAKNAKTSHVTATDISSAAIEIARENVALHRVANQVDVIESDLFASIPHGSKYDVIASNPPYIPSAEIDQLDAEVARHEPRIALDGGTDGLTILKRIIDEAPAFAASNGLLLLEFTSEQADSLKAIVANHGAYDEIEVRKDLAHRPRVLKARFQG
ncbi:MAG: HemK/PrmC family methyltransferase, partial [Schlesneria sp.]